MTQEQNGILVEVDGTISSLLLELENEADNKIGGWVSREDLLTETGLSDNALTSLIKFVNSHIRSIEIKEREYRGRKQYRGIWRTLDNSHVPFEGAFTERPVEIQYVEKPVEVYVDKIVEKPIFVPQAIEVGALLRPAIASQKRSTKKKSEESGNGIIVWAGDPGTPDKLKEFIVPSYYETMKNMVSWGRHVGLEGPPGIGKSTAVEQLAVEHGKTLVNISADAGLHRRDLTGFAEIAKGESFFMAAEYITAVREGWWVKIDEVNAADPDVLLFLNSQMNPPYVANAHGTSIRVHPDFRLFVTYNRGLAGTKILPQAFVDRFFLIQVGYPDENTLKKLLILRGASEESFIDSAIQIAKSLWDTKSIRFQLSPRRLFDAILLHRDGADAQESFLKGILPYVWIPQEESVVKDTIIRCCAKGGIDVQG